MLSALCIFLLSSWCSWQVCEECLSDNCKGNECRNLWATSLRALRVTRNNGVFLWCFSVLVIRILTFMVFAEFLLWRNSRYFWETFFQQKLWYFLKKSGVLFLFGILQKSGEYFLIGLFFKFFWYPFFVVVENCQNNAGTNHSLQI